jgi:putative nucleotidyltransferase with HDIG domain
MVCRKFSEKLGTADHEKAYMSGLMHDIGFMVNCLVFSRGFATAMERALREEIPLDEAERVTMGFTHCETGRAVAEQWKLADDVVEVIAHHHARRAKPEGTATSGAGALELPSLPHARPGLRILRAAQSGLGV